jgi:sigma-B regulation protein RsbU (phosphoserine phosphatase)
VIVAADSPSRPADYRELMKKVESFVETLDRSDNPDDAIHKAADGILAEFHDELGLGGGRIYKREDDENYLLLATFGHAKQLPQGIRLPRSYPPIDRLLTERTLFMSRRDPGADPSLEECLGVEEFAAIEVGNEGYLIAFDVGPGPQRDEILFSLGILRHTINERLRRERMEGIFKEAQRIQTSILPRRAPEYGDFQIAGRTQPLETVGGDFFDYIPVTNKILGVAIADVSGHGLPAALQVRDIYTGMRMGLGRDFKIVRIVERLNRIIHESTLTSRFVSMFYGELELNGLFIYVNAGHPPAFRLRRNGEVEYLEEGGAVLGPLAEATYERGIITFRPGEVIVLYTDGIVEAARPDAGGEREEYGVERLLAAVRQAQQRPAGEILDAVFADVVAFEEGQPQADDRTVVVIKYPEAS